MPANPNTTPLACDATLCPSDDPEFPRWCAPAGVVPLRDVAAGRFDSSDATSLRSVLMTVAAALTFRGRQCDEFEDAFGAMSAGVAGALGGS